MGAFIIQDVYKIAGIGLVPVGKVEKGTIRVGMKLYIDGRNFEIKNIEMHHLPLAEAKSGDNVAISLRLVDDIRMIATGSKKSFFQKIFGAKEEYDMAKHFYRGRRLEFTD